jgi:DNA-binding PadR family transcriptional regulator
MRRLSITVLSVLQAIADDHHYGFDIIDVTGLPSGTVYPALSRLERDGYVRSAWEDDARAHREGRPARRYYRVTAPGVRALNETRDYYSKLAGLGAPRVSRAKA